MFRNSPFLILLLCLLGGPAGAAEVDLTGEQFARIERALQWSLSRAELDRQWQQLDTLRKAAADCRQNAEKDLESVQRDLADLGEASDTDTAAVKRVRKSLTTAARRLTERRVLCREQEANAQRLQANVEQRRSQTLKEERLQRQLSLLDIDQKILAEAWPRIRANRLGWAEAGWQPATSRHLLWLTLLTLAGWLGGRLLRRYLQVCRAQSLGEDFIDRLARTSATALARQAVPTLLVVGWAGYWGVQSWLLDRHLPMFSLTLVLLAYLLWLFGIRTLLHTNDERSVLIDKPVEVTRSLRRHLGQLGAFMALYLILSHLPLQHAPTEISAAIGRLFSLVLLVLLLGRLFRSYARFHPEQSYWLVGGVGGLVALAILVSEVLGYRSLTDYLLQGTLGSVGLVLLGWLVSSLWSDLLLSFDTARYHWQQQLRIRLNIDPERGLPGMVWLRLIGAASIWIAIAWALMRLWDVSDATRSQLRSYLFEGFELGTVQVIPIRIIIAMLLFSLLGVAVGWFKRQLDNRWLAGTRMDPGAHNALVTMTGYIGMSIALIASLALAGVDFSALALIAGALSVGIGFGLQNIVNNFVSGLILLFERPIRRGDWIVVGGTEGYVQRISIRSTLVRTFDRADVIVPNSELLSSQVTNWMLEDKKGRVKVPVGVAYGSDAEQVREILLAIADKHPLRVRDGSVPVPRVLFLSFGDSALNFELRFFIRDVDAKLQVVSDVNFEIEKAFREAGIEIPFPQRVVHMLKDSGSPDRAC